MMESNEQHSVMVSLWVPVAIFAHLFAAVWLVRAFQLFQPAVWARLTARLGLRTPVTLPSCQTTSTVETHLPATRACQCWAPKVPVIPPRETKFAVSVSASSPHDAAAAAATTAAAARYPVIRYGSIKQTASTGSCSSSEASSSDRAPHALAVVSSQDSLALKQQVQGVSYGQHLQQLRLPHLQLCWQGISCSYKTAAGSKAVLQDIWGQANSGELQALLGPSGAGKSHLLDILAQRKSTGNITGDILLNGQKISSSSYRRKVAYVPQDDNFIPALSAAECLVFYAAMVLPNTSAAARQTGITSRTLGHRRHQSCQHSEAVQHVLDVVGLSKHASTMVGGRLPGGLLLRGLSSGERRRLSIAVGILADPSVLFLDEPTSGLDSFAALSVMSHLQGLAHGSGKAVVTAIHQPRSAIWSLFDKVTLLASGLLVYHGATAGLVPWLSSGLGYSYRPDSDGLVSDWALDLVVVDFNKPQAFQGRTMTSLEDLQAAAAAFKQHYFKHREQHRDKQPTSQSALDRLPNSGPGLLTAYAASHHQPQQTVLQGPFSRGASSADLDDPSTVSICSSQDMSDANHSSNASSSETASCSTSSDQQSDDLSQQSAVASSVGSNGSFKTAAHVLQTLTTTPTGMVHAQDPVIQLTEGSCSDADCQSCSKVQPAEVAVTCDNSSLSSDSSFEISAAPTQVQLQVLTGGAPAGLQDSSGASTDSSSYPSNLWRQYQALAWRELLRITRNPADVAGRTLTFTWVALLVGLIYYDLPLDASSIRQRLNLLFATLCFFLLMPFISMSMYTDDKGVYLADRAARLYRPIAYYFAKASTVLPFNILSSLCYSLIQYGMTGMRPGAMTVAKHGTIGTLTSLIAVQVLHLAATITPNQDAAFMMGIGWTCTNLVMSGFFIPYREIRFSALANLRYLSALHYAFEGLLGVEFQGRLFPCPAAGLDSVSADFFTQLLPGAASLVTPAMLQRITDGSDAGCVVDSDAVAQYFGFGKSFGTTVGVLAGYLGVLHVMTFLAMLVVARREGR